MASRKKPLNDRPLTELVDDLLADPQMRGALIEADAAREAAKLMRDARQRRGISQAEIAKALGVSQARISQVESGRIEDIPPLEFLARFMNECGEGLVLTTTAPAAEVRPQHQRGPDTAYHEGRRHTVQRRRRREAASSRREDEGPASPFVRLSELAAKIEAAKEDD